MTRAPRPHVAVELFEAIADPCVGLLVALTGDRETRKRYVALLHRLLAVRDGGRL